MNNEFVLYKVGYETIREKDGGPFPKKMYRFLESYIGHVYVNVIYGDEQT